MRLVRLPGYSDTWINPDHVVSVEPYAGNGGTYAEVHTEIHMSDGSKWVVTEGRENVLHSLLGNP